MPRLVSLVYEMDADPDRDARAPQASLESVVETLLALRSADDVDVEVLLVSDPGAVAPSVLSDFTRRLAQTARTVRYLDQLDLPYFERKGFAARQARGEVVLFADTDCVYESQWAATLVRALDGPDVSVAHGRTFAWMQTPFSKVSAVAWQFPTTEDVDPLASIDHRWGNNFAARRQVFDCTPIPRIDPRPSRECKIQSAPWDAAVDRTPGMRVGVNAEAWHRQFDSAWSLIRRMYEHGLEWDLRDHLQGVAIRRRVGNAGRSLIASPWGSARRRTRLREPLGLSRVQNMQALTVLPLCRVGECLGRTVGLFRNKRYRLLVPGE